MIVITDGESHDSPQLMEAVSDSKEDNITMYAIAVSSLTSIQKYLTQFARFPVSF